MNRIAAVVAGLLLAFVGTSATFAATINVPGDQPTIAAAISASVNGDVINIAAGTYNEHSLNPGGKAITIGSASGNLDVTIDAQQGGSVFYIESGESHGTVIKNLVLTGGSSPSGGGIFCYESSPTFTGCTIEGNQSDYGGGIFCISSNFTITDCTISGNSASQSGGGIYCSLRCSPTITGCTISGNTSVNFGGGIYCSMTSNPTLNYTVICGNTGGQADCLSGTDCYTNNGSGISDDCGTSSVIVAMGLQIQNLSTNMAQQQSTIEDLQKVVAACCATKTCAGDENNDGVVNIDDLLIVISVWGPCP